MQDSFRVDHIYRAGCEQAPDRPALIDHDTIWTYRDLAAAVDNTADWLQQQPIEPGDRLMIVSDNAAQAVALYFAALRRDLWPVLVNARLAAPELQAIAAHATPRLIMFATSRSIHATRHAERAKARTITLPTLGSVAAAPIDHRAIAEATHGDPARDVAALVYTSGSTGAPRGVMLTHRNLRFMAQTTAAIRQLGPSDRFLGVLPISHIVGLAVVLLGTLLSGGTVRMVGRFNPSTLSTMLAQGELTVMLGAPAMYAMTVEHARLHRITRLDTPHLRLLGSCGAPLDAETKRATEALFGQTLHNGYGTTETAPTIAQTRPERPRPTCTVGALLPGIEAQLRDDQGDTVPPGQPGILHVRGPNVMRGYYRDEAATAAVLDSHGWFDTRDRARFDGEDLTILGRARDLIIRSGHNVAPSDIEAALNAHPAILQSAVIGVPVAGDEDIIAYVQPVEGAIVTDAELAAHAAARLAPHERPLRYIRVAMFDLAPNGKILKTGLRPAYPIDAKETG